MTETDKSQTDFDTRAFRDGLARFATGVAVVIARDAAGHVASMTINSFASVSLQPPLVLWSLRTDSSSVNVYRTAAGFTISILAAHQEPIARKLARSDGAKLEGIDLAEAPSGLPRIAGAAAWFDCRPWALYAAGDHDISVGEVTAFGTTSSPTLIFHDGRFLQSDAC